MGVQRFRHPQRVSQNANYTTRLTDPYWSIQLPKQGYYPQKHTRNIDHKLQKRFQTLIGSLLYLMLGTRPDIAFTITQLAQHTANPSLDHYNWALYICCYLVGTQNYSLVYRREPGLSVYAHTDSDWASNPEDRRSQTGYVRGNPLKSKDPLKSL